MCEFLSTECVRAKKRNELSKTERVDQVDKSMIQFRVRGGKWEIPVVGYCSRIMMNGVKRFFLFSQTLCRRFIKFRLSLPLCYSLRKERKKSCTIVDNALLLSQQSASFQAFAAVIKFLSPPTPIHNLWLCSATDIKLLLRFAKGQARIHKKQRFSPEALCFHWKVFYAFFRLARWLARSASTAENICCKNTN